MIRKKRLSHVNRKDDSCKLFVNYKLSS